METNNRIVNNITIKNRVPTSFSTRGKHGQVEKKQFVENLGDAGYDAGAVSVEEADFDR